MAPRMTSASMPHFSSRSCFGSLERRYAADLANSSGVRLSITRLRFSVLSLIGRTARSLSAVVLYVTASQQQATADIKNLEPALLNQPCDSLPRDSANACCFGLRHPVFGFEVFRHKNG